MYFIAEGQIELRCEEGTTVLQTEAFFGDEALFNDGRRCYSVRCLTNAILFTLSQTNLLTIISECPAVALGFLAVYATQMPQRSLADIKNAF
jgi:CRP-like cAMP-binding protein